MSEEKKVDPQADRRREWTEMAYLLAEAMNEQRVREGKTPLPKERVDIAAQKFVDGKLASEAAARQNRQD